MKKFIFIILLLAGGITTACSEKPLSPRFTLTRGELEELLGGLPAGPAILEDPGPFLEQVYRILHQPEELLWLVDKSHKLPADYAPGDLVDLKDYPVKITKASLLVRELILEDLLVMVLSAGAEGLQLTCASTYRSYDTQLWLFDYWVKELGQAEAELVSARAGTSQHQLGTTIDFHPIEDSFGSLPESAWLQREAWKYGFSLSYPRGYQQVTGYTYEPWHWRYIGRTAAELCHTYFDDLQQAYLEFWQEKEAAFRAAMLTESL